MCCLFGMIDYGHSFTGKEKTKMIRALATASEARGTDATGIAYNSRGRLRVYKRPIPGHQLSLYIPYDAAVVMGHTRMMTQGDSKRNYNNHPFRAKSGGMEFALAHNGVLHNDRTLRKALKLPETRIETDSFIAVQLLQERKAITFNSLKYMAEMVEGSFAFTVLDGTDRLYFVKGDNPLCIYHYPRLGLYLYASTRQILMDALFQLPRLPDKAEQVAIDGGELLMIGPDGKEQRSSFQFDDLPLPCAYEGWGWPSWRATSRGWADYIRAIQNVAGAYGISPDQIDQLLEEGVEPEEIVDYLYCGEVSRWSAI